MKISITHLRIGMILANLGLAAILVVHYVRSVWKPTESTGWSGVTIRAPGEFEPKADGRAAARGSTAARMASIAPYLEPQKPTVIDPLQTAAAEDATEGEVESEEVREGGPLAENWEYVWLLNFRDSPLDSRVKLRRKAPETRTSSVPGRPQTAIRPGRSITSTRRFPTSAARRTVQPGQEILLKVRERYYKDENLQVDFWIDSADEEKMVYWEPDKPGKFYELKRVASTQYEREDRTVLRPLEDTSEEKEEKAAGEADDDEKQKLWVIRDRAVFEDVREEEYSQLRKGEQVALEVLRSRSPRLPGGGRTGTPGVAQQPVPQLQQPPPPQPTPPAPGSRRTGPPGAPGRTPPTADGEPAAPGAAESAAGQGGSEQNAAGGPYTDPQEREKALKELGEAVRELPPEAQQEINEALRGNPQR